MLVISCHADTNFSKHTLQKQADGSYLGHMDNFVGVYSVMQAYFSGRMNKDYVRIELTYGEEVGFIGAYEVLNSIKQDDMVIVVDVTGVETKKDIVIEKCMNPCVERFLKETLDPESFDLYKGCKDPVANCDESDVYREISEHVFFLGVPCFGGDYNEIPVGCYQRNIDGISEAICKIVEQYPTYCQQHNLDI